MSSAIEILYEDNHLIAVNKRPSDLVQADKTKDRTLGDKIRKYLVKTYNKPGDAYLGIIHRIDRPVSGVVVFAKTSKALKRMQKQFVERSVQKYYWAVVKNQPPAEEGQLSHWMWKNEANNKSFASLTDKKGRKRAELTYRLLRHLDNYFLLEVKPATGRHHQIRVQLSTMGCPIKGDVKYGFGRTNKDASIHLHARKITFIHPVKQEPVTIVAPAPDDVIWQKCEELMEGS